MIEPKRLALGKNRKDRIRHSDIAESVFLRQRRRGEVEMTEEYIVKHESTDNSESIGYVQPLVRCKNCIYRGKSKKCVLAAISEEKDFPLFMLDNRGEWFCADGKRRTNDG